jgi:threonine/homoserine/homoserine lactone efflux protein
MDVGFFVRGLALGFAIAAAVGPVSLLVIRRTLAEGRRYGFVSGLGVAAADGTYGGIAAFGLTALTDLLVGWRRILGVVGAAFLLWLAWRTATAVPRDAARDAVPRQRRRDLAAAFGSMFTLTLANPATVVSFAALFLGLGVTGRDAGTAASLTAGVWTGSAAWWLLLTSVVAAIRGRVTPAWLGRINVVAGIVIAGFALAALYAALTG